MLWVSLHGWLLIAVGAVVALFVLVAVSVPLFLNTDNFRQRSRKSHPVAGAEGDDWEAEPVGVVGRTGGGEYDGR